nr:MAG TPA: hypothetical protein [Caudoviricetes sp.]
MKHRNLKAVNSTCRIWGKSPRACKKVYTRIMRARVNQSVRKELSDER